jgi:hypothetical protein
MDGWMEGEKRIWTSLSTSLNHRLTWRHSCTAPAQVYVYDTRQFPFHRAETYLQFKESPPSLKQAQLTAGHIGPTGCTEPTA